MFLDDVFKGITDPIRDVSKIPKDIADEAAKMLKELRDTMMAILKMPLEILKMLFTPGPFSYMLLAVAGLYVVGTIVK